MIICFDFLGVFILFPFFRLQRYDYFCYGIMQCVKISWNTNISIIIIILAKQFMFICCSFCNYFMLYGK